MKPAREIELKAQVASLEAQLVALDERMGRDTEAIVRRYEIALREIASFSDAGSVGHAQTWVRVQIGVAARALAIDPTTLPKKRCMAPACHLPRGHGGQHFDGLLSWGKTKKPTRNPFEAAP